MKERSKVILESEKENSTRKLVTTCTNGLFLEERLVTVLGIIKKDQIMHSRAKSNENMSVDDMAFIDENTNSASNMSETGLLSVDIDNVQNIGTPCIPVVNSNRNCEEQTVEENSYKDSRGSKTGCNKEGEMDNNDRSTDINLVVYADAETLVERQDSTREANGESLNKIDQNNLSELILETKNNSLPTRNKGQNEHGTLRKNAGSTESFQCDFCRRKFNSKIKLGIHTEKHSNLSIQCTQCSYITGSSKLLEYHQNIHKEKFKCKFCNKLFTRRIYLKYHIKDIHRKSRRLHNCEVCSAKFLSLSGLKMHIQSVHEPDGYSCPFCDYVGKSTNNLSCHIARTHKKKYKCNACEYESLTQGGLDRHAKIYHNPEERQFACKHCSYRGQKRRQLLDHERTVHGQLKNKHLCPVCKKFFKTQVLMKHHLPSHSDRQLYSCKGCNYRTRFRQTLHLHIKNSHPGENFKTLGKGPSDADFGDIVQAALQNIELFPSCVEQNMEIDYVTQVPEDCHTVEDNDNFVNISSVSKQTTQTLEMPSQNVETYTEEVTTNQILTLQNHKPEESAETELIESSLVTEEVVESMPDLNSEIVNSDHAVTVISSSEMTNSNVVNFSSDVQTGKEDMQSLFPLNGFNLEDGKIHQVVTLVDNLNTMGETNEQAVMLLNNVVKHKVTEHSTVTHISLMENNNPNQENLVILPLGDAKVAIIQSENFSAIQGDNPLVLGDQSSLLDLIPDQNELVHQTQENVNQVTVYLPP